MGWVVKTWRAEVVASAEREARRMRRNTRREQAQALAELDALEELGRSLLERLRQEQPARVVTDVVAEELPATSTGRFRHSAARRASLRDSPLAGLFLPTG